MEPAPARVRRIAFVSNNTWSMYNFRKEVLQHFLLQGHEVYVIAPADQFAPKLIALGCKLIPIQFDNRSENPVRDLGLYRSLRKLYRQINADVIFHYVIKPNIYGSLAAGSLGIPSVAVITGLGYTFSRANLLNRIVKRLYRFALRKSHAVWFLNQDDARSFVSAGIVPSQVAAVLPGEGVDSNFFTPLAEPPSRAPFIFLMSARLLRSKGHEYFAGAARILKSKGYIFECWIIGFAEKNHLDSVTPDTLEYWEREGIVRFKGFTEDVRDFLSVVHCFVLPTNYHEGLSRGIMEAASMGLPVITTFQRGCKELVIDQQTGFFCNAEDAFDLADKMEQVILMPEPARVAMGKAGRRMVNEKFTITKVIHRYDSMVNNSLPI